MNGGYVRIWIEADIVKSIVLPQYLSTETDQIYEKLLCFPLSFSCNLTVFL